MQTVGFNRFVRKEWMDYTAFLASNSDNNVKQIKDKLNEYLKAEVKAEITREKAVAQLTRMWVDVQKKNLSLKKEALALFEKVSQDEKMLIHWSMTILTFPIFVDVATSIGKIFNLQDHFSLKTLEKRIFEKWGERSTVKYALQKIVGSMADWGIIKRVKVGEYTRTEKIEIENIELKFFFLRCYLTALEKDYLKFIEANNLALAFPFHINLRLEDFNISDTLTLNKVGSDVVIMGNIIKN